MATNLELAKLSELVYDTDGGAGRLGQVMGSEWKWYGDPGSVGLNFTNGYYAAAYRNTITNEVVIANRGTEPTDSGDIADDLRVMAQKVPNQFMSAQDFYSAVKRKVSQDQTFEAPPAYVQTGHSLGGGIASLMGASTGDSTVVFNAIGVKEILPQVYLDESANYNNILSLSAFTGAQDHARGRQGTIVANDELPPASGALECALPAPPRLLSIRKKPAMAGFFRCPT